MALERTEINAKRLLAAALALVLLALVLWSILFYRNLNAATPEFEEWQAAAQAIQQEMQAGDAVAITPFWATMGERAFVEAGLSYQYLRWIAQEDWPGVKRLWVVEGYDRFVDRDELLAKGAVLQETRSIGPLNVQRFELPSPGGPVFDFYDHLSEAQVYTKRNGKRDECSSWNEKERKFSCSLRQQWHYVGQLTQEIGDAVRHTIWCHPVRGKEIHIRFEQVPIRQKLVIHSGLTDYAVADKNGGKVFIDAWVDGKRIGQAVQENVDGWHRHAFELKNPTGKPHTVEFVVTTPRDGRRHFSFNAYGQ